MRNISAKYIGIITGLAMVSLAVFMFYGMKLPPNGKNQYLILGLFTAGIIWCLLSFKRKYPDESSFKKYFSEGFKTFIIIALMMAAFTFIFYKMNPQILEEAIKENDVLLLKEGDHTPAEIASNSEKLRSIFMPMMVTINTIKFLFLGALITAVGGGLLSQKKTV